MPAGLLLPALVVLFFVSGACGLIYQVLWLRLLGLVFGVTVYSASTVWASFMAGLALGSFAGGRLGDRVRNPLIWFGVVEVFVGLSALATPSVLTALQGFYGRVHGSLPDTLVTVTLVRGAMSFLVLLVPTLLMGATLPLIVRSSLGQRQDVGGRVGLLYGTNTAGAIAGTLAAGLVLIPALGISRTFQLGAALNVSVGLVAVLLGWMAGRRPIETTADVGTADTASHDGAGLGTGHRAAVLCVFAVSGFATLALEVIWFRAVVLVARPTVYTFAAMLASVLAGIAAGSYLVTPLLRRGRSWLLPLAVIEVLMAFTALTSFAALGSTANVERAIAPYVSSVLPAYLAHPFAAALPAILPTAVLMGIAYPIGLRLWVGSGHANARRAASRIGLFNSLNLVGAIGGSLAAGFFMLPAWGSRTSLIVVAGLVLASGLGLLILALESLVTRALATTVLAILFVAAAAKTVDPFRVFLDVRYPNEAVASHEEAVEGTVSVHGDRPGHYKLVLDGNHQANDTGPMLAVHRRIGLMALAIHPEARDVLVVGLGGGATPGAISNHEGVDLDVVELSSAVVRASGFFAHANNDLLSRPNVRLRVDDGRNFLALTRRKYDVITADLILPIHAGSNNVYAKEYFELVRRALKPGGMAMQWASGTDAEYRAIVRTFRTVFPHTTVWADGSLLLGTVEPLVLRKSDFDWKLQMPNRREGLATLGLRSFEDLLGMYRAGPDELEAFLGPGPILTDDRPLAEYFLSLPRGPGPNLSGLKGDVTRHVR
jgi:spermidine synthase